VTNQVVHARRSGRSKSRLLRLRQGAHPLESARDRYAPVNGPRLSVTWPLVVLFVAFPLWWYLGVSAFTWPIVAIPMLVALVLRGQTRAPVAMILWLAFLSWMLLSGLQLESVTTIMTFVYRFSLYTAAAVLFLYVYNMPRGGPADSKALRILTLFWMVVVAGGYAGILLPGHSFVPPFDDLLTPWLRNSEFVKELVQPVFAQVQTFLGYPVPRPAAPFTYTNEWGGNIAVLTPVAFAAISTAGRGWWRRLVIVVLIASLVPMAFSLDRGMFVSLAIGIAYVTVRLAMRGHLGALATLLALAVLTMLIAVLTPLGHLVVSSFASTHGQSNATRVSLYQQASAGANASPLFGYGAPKPVVGQVGSPAIGTQGQLWMVLYSHGYPALVFFLGFFLAVLWQTRRARGTAGLWLHSVALVALAQVAVYGWLPVELQVVMVAAALAYRSCWSSPPSQVEQATPHAEAPRDFRQLVGAGQLAGSPP
jgi:polysaccharide biosynthesis protein PslJ